jgi:hypothetical protein
LKFFSQKFNPPVIEGRAIDAVAPVNNVLRQYVSSQINE